MRFYVVKNQRMVNGFNDKSAVIHMGDLCRKGFHEGLLSIRDKRYFCQYPPLVISKTYIAGKRIYDIIGNKNFYR